MKQTLTILILLFSFTACVKPPIAVEHKKRNFTQWNDTSTIEQRLPYSWKVESLDLPFSKAYIHRKYTILSNLESKNVFIKDYGYALTQKVFDYSPTDYNDFFQISRKLESDTIELYCEGHGQNEIHIINKKTRKRKMLYSRIGYDDSTCSDEYTLTYDGNIIIYTSINQSQDTYFITFYDLKYAQEIKRIVIPNVSYFKSISITPDGEYLLVQANRYNDFFYIRLHSISKTYDDFLQKHIENSSLEEINTFLEKQRKYFSKPEHFEMLFTYKYRLANAQNTTKAYRDFLRSIRSFIVKVPLANVRQKPTTHAQIVAKLSKGTYVQVLQEKNGWYEIQLPQKKAWIHKSLIRTTSPKKYKKMAQSALQKLHKEHLRKTTDIRSLQKHLTQQPNDIKIKNKLIKLLRKKHTSSSYLRAYRYSHDTTDLLNAKKSAHSKREKSAVRAVYENIDYQHLDEENLAQLVTFIKKYPHSKHREEILENINFRLNIELKNHYHSLKKLQELLTQYPDFEVSKKIAKRIKTLKGQ